MQGVKWKGQINALGLLNNVEEPPWNLRTQKYQYLYLRELDNHTNEVDTMSQVYYW